MTKNHGKHPFNTHFPSDDRVLPDYALVKTYDIAGRSSTVYNVRADKPPNADISSGVKPDGPPDVYDPRADRLLEVGEPSAADLRNVDVPSTDDLLSDDKLLRGIADEPPDLTSTGSLRNDYSVVEKGPGFKEAPTGQYAVDTADKGAGALPHPAIDRGRQLIPDGTRDFLDGVPAWTYLPPCGHEVLYRTRLSVNNDESQLVEKARPGGTLAPPFTKKGDGYGSNNDDDDGLRWGICQKCRRRFDADKQTTETPPRAGTLKLTDRGIGTLADDAIVNNRVTAWLATTGYRYGPIPGATVEWIADHVGCTVSVVHAVKKKGITRVAHEGVGNKGPRNSPRRQGSHKVTWPSELGSTLGTVKRNTVTRQPKAITYYTSLDLATEYFDWDIDVPANRTKDIFWDIPKFRDWAWERETTTDTVDRIWALRRVTKVPRVFPKRDDLAAAQETFWTRVDQFAGCGATRLAQAERTDGSKQPAKPYRPAPQHVVSKPQPGKKTRAEIAALAAIAAAAAASPLGYSAWAELPPKYRGDTPDRVTELLRPTSPTFEARMRWSARVKIASKNRVLADAGARVN